MNRKTAGVIVIVIIAAAAIAPIAIYGLEVDVASVSMGLNVGSGSLGSLGVDSAQVPNFDVGLSQVEVDVGSMNSYQYVITGVTGRTEVNEENAEDGAIVDISIIFTLQTPSNHTIEITLEPGNAEGTGEKIVKTTLGPDEGIETSGEFHLSIVIMIKITPPGFDEPVLDLDLEPVNRTFTIPNN
ncbi:MAG: hypothetical protein ACOC3C_01870 [Candidatus Thorarchaeota archaeon]